MFQCNTSVTLGSLSGDHMPTTKKRINITIDDELYRSLDHLSKKEKVTLSSVSLRLIERAVELEEDLYFSREAEKRLSKNEKRVKHSKAWKE